MGYKEQNKKTIENAILAFKARVQEPWQPRIEFVLDKGAEFCLKEHIWEHKTYSNHLHMAKTYGWVLFYNGVEVKRKIIENDGTAEVEGNVDKFLSLMGQRATRGYNGFVVAAMEDENGDMSYFKWVVEAKIIRLAIEDLRSVDYSSIFKPL